jgi:hypothetical protein
LFEAVHMEAIGFVHEASEPLVESAM